MPAQLKRQRTGSRYCDGDLYVHFSYIYIALFYDTSSIDTMSIAFVMYFTTIVCPMVCKSTMVYVDLCGSPFFFKV